MGKIRVAALGDEKQEKAQKKKAEVRREAKKAKKEKAETPETDVLSTVPETVEAEAKTDGKEKKGKGEDGEVKPKTRSPKYLKAVKMVEKDTLYTLADAVELLKKTSFSKFDGTVELHMNLNKAILGDKADYRNSVTLPHGTGKEVKVVVADEDTIKDIEAGKFAFDILVAHPSMMPKLAKVARILGPKGLMPNPKNGTVTDDPEKRAKELSGGKVNFKSEPGNPIVHLSIGKVSFDDKKLTENIKAVFEVVGLSKIVKATISATMGPGIKLKV